MKTIRLKNSAALLKQYQPSYVDKLLKDYSDRSDFILGRDQLGKDEKILAKDTYELEAKMALETLTVIKDRISPNFDHMKKRYARSKKLRLYAAIVTAVTSAGLITLSRQNQTLLIVNSVLNLASALFLLVANSLDAPSIDGTRSLAGIFGTLNQIFAEAEKVEVQLLKVIASTNFNDLALPLIEKAENLAVDLRKLERELL
jgi:hypothetical protein